MQRSVECTLSLSNVAELTVGLSAFDEKAAMPTSPDFGVFNGKVCFYFWKLTPDYKDTIFGSPRVADARKPCSSSPHYLRDLTTVQSS